ncbi:hypothetical protein BLOT_003805 [Blomia tropicalis]|nr:hypothetical protein BLOT_003805 [Blomia tropicalis]
MASTNNQVNLGDRWLPFRQLSSLIKSALVDGSSSASSKLEESLLRHKTEFISFLKNPLKNNLHREVVQNASKDGIMIIENQNRFKSVISQDLVSESLLFSDIFNLNELSSLELLITGENQLTRYPDMSRGTIAVLYYYDGRRSVANILQTLVQARNGRSWTSKLSREMSRFINKFTDELKEDGIVSRCIDILLDFDIVSEFEMLERNRALGPYGYRKRVLDIMKETRNLVANIIFNYAAQTNFTKNEIFKLLELISKKSILENDHLDFVSSSLLVSLLYTIDISFIQNLDDTDRQLVKTNWIKDPSIIIEFCTKLENTEFGVKGVKNIIKFALAISLKTLALYPISGFEVEIDEEKMIDSVIDENVFEQLYKLIAQNGNLYKEEFFVRRINTLHCDFIVNMNQKIKELRDKADESGRILNAFSAESIKPFSSLSLQFESFLKYLASFYLFDTYELSSQFWVTLEHGKTVTHKQQVLHKFVRNLHESFFPQILHASVINFFRSLARSSAFNVFNLIKNTGFHTSIQFSIGSFSEALHHYLCAVRGTDNKDRISASTFTLIGNNLINIHTPSNKVLIEADTICAIVNLIEEIVKNDRTCCVAIAESQQYGFIPNMVNILRCAVPRELKSKILTCFAAFAKTPSVSTLIWKEIDTILPRYNQGILSHQKLWQNGIAIEIEEIEVKNEEYPITIGFLELMNILFSHYEPGLSAHQQSVSESCFNFILDSILLKSIYRVFKNDYEKWIITKLCYKLLLNIVQKYDFNSETVNARMFHVFTQMLQENLLFRHIISTLEDAVNYMESYRNSPTLKDHDTLYGEVQECVTTILTLLTNVCEKQALFFEVIRKIPGLSISTFIKMDVLFNNINVKTNKQDRLVILFRLIPFSTTISIRVLKLLNTLCESNFEMTYLCLMQLHNCQLSTLKSELLINMFVECLESDSRILRKETLQFIDTYLGNVSTNLRYNFAHKLVGIESNLFSLKNINLFGQNYTCLHSILSLFDPLVDLNEVIDERKIGMRIIYKLSSSVHTHEIVLRVLRSSYDFNMQYMKFWDKLNSEQNYSKDLLKSLLSEMTLFMKILAIDIKITSGQKLKSYFSSYINFLFKETKKPRIIEILYEFVFHHEHPTIMSFDYFNSKELMKTIESCLNEDNSVNLPFLHQKLYNEIHSLGPQIGVSSASLLKDEINNIMLYCTSVNKSIDTLNQKIEFVESWCELVQVIILCNCLGSMEEEVHSRYLSEINLELIGKMLDQNTNHLLFSSISSTILIASYSLNEIKSQSVTNISSCIRSILQTLESNSSIWSQQKRARVNFYGSLLYLFQLLPSNLFKEIRFSNNLLDRLTKDVLSGHEVAKMLSISILNRSDTSNWLNELILNGTLKQLLLSILSDDRDIRANKYEFIKTFYVFESKMMLLLKTFSSQNSSSLLLNNLDIVSTLESLQSFDMYPYLICENPVCFKMFIDILRFIITITTNTNHQIISEVGAFISTRSILYDLIRIAPTIKESENGKELLLLVSRLVGRLILNVNHNLQNSFIGMLSLYVDENSLTSASEIVFTILHSCVQLISFNASNPIFEPSLINTDSRIHSKHSLGLLVSIINTCTLRSNEIPKCVYIVENSLYLIWTHFNIFFTMMNPLPEQIEELETLKSQAENTFNDAFFSKIQTISQKNTFIDALSRRIKRIIYLKKSSNLLQV